MSPIQQQATMQTIDKALGLLNLFSEERPAIGLSEIARISGFNKATTRRFLLALGKHGFVDQDASSRAYRLGPGLLRLARVRESVSPVESVVQPILEELASMLGETAHFSLYSGGALATIGLVESPKSNRVMLEMGEALPLHATASGLAYLAFATPAIVKAALRKPLPMFTQHTMTRANDVLKALTSVARTGVASIKSAYEDGVCGIASPVFDGEGVAIGAVAVAAPVSRAPRKVITEMQAEIRNAATKITLALGGEPHSTIARAQTG